MPQINFWGFKKYLKKKHPAKISLIAEPKKRKKNFCASLLPCPALNKLMLYIFSIFLLECTGLDLLEL